jgi:glutamate/tyrosine decarboxylase-like PLP-dependent enzyme
VSANPASEAQNTEERSLDPEDWDAFGALAHRALDEMIDYLQTIRERPVWQPLPENAKARFREPLPRAPSPGSDVYEQVQEHILPYPTNNIHPRFWSWVGGTGTPTQLIADMVISTMNSAGLGFDEVASSHVELQLLDWLKTLFGFPTDASGLLVSGGSMANLVGLAVARTSKAPYDIRADGVDADSHPRLMYYASTETHSSVRKAVELIGLGNESLRMIPVNADFTIDIVALRAAIEEDRANGRLPACIVGNAGTVNTGATDNLEELADIAEAENLWLHVDGAFGACARLSPESADLVAGMERAHSLAFDLHKWLYVQYDCGGVLIRGSEPHKETFSVIPSYLRSLDRGLASGPLNFSEYGVQLSRSFKALRAWMALKTEGSDRYGQQIEQNIRQAQYLSARVDAHPELERLAPTAMNIVNYRYAGTPDSEVDLNELNAELLMQLQERGIAAPSSTQLNGKFSIRVAICNHRSTRSDFDALLEGSVNLGRQLLAQ